MELANTTKTELAYVTSRKEMLQISFSRSLSKEIWNQRQKRFSLGLSDFPENRKIAEKIAIQIQQDIKANRLEKNLEFYLPANQLKKEIGIAYDPDRIDISLMDLFMMYAEFKKPRLAESTYKDRYLKRYVNNLKKCPQDLNKQPELIRCLHEVMNMSDFIGLSGILASMLDWAKKNDKITKNARNDLRDLSKDYRTAIPKRKPSQLLQKMDDYVEEKTIKGYTPEEAKIIIEAFEEYKNQKSVMRKNGCNYPLPEFQIEARETVYDYIRLCFWTGCRLSEASGLRWQDIDEECNFIIFRNAYNMRIKKLKALKTEKVGEEGTKPRKFPCGVKLKNLLLELKAKCRHNPSDHLFVNTSGNMYHYQNLEAIWYGRRKRYETDWKQGVVVRLVEEKKVCQYLTPYSTRHTWINHQLANNVPIANVAKYAGNSPEVILKNYVSFIHNAPLAKEF